MTSSGHESKTLNDLFVEDLEEAVDYGSDTSFLEDYESKPSPKGKDETRHTPNPFPEHGVADTLTSMRSAPGETPISPITNPLDEQQNQQ